MVEQSRGMKGSEVRFWGAKPEKASLMRCYLGKDLDIMRDGALQRWGQAVHSQGREEMMELRKIKR